MDKKLVVVLISLVVVSTVVVAAVYYKSLVDQHTFTCPQDAKYCTIWHNGSLRPGKSSTYKLYAVFKNVTTTSTIATTTVPVTTTTTISTTVATTTVPVTTTTFTCGDGTGGTTLCCAREIPCVPFVEGVTCIIEVPC